MGGTLGIKAETVVRRIAAKILGDYTPPRLRHSQELLAELESASVLQPDAGEWKQFAAAISDALRENGADQFLRLPPIAKTLHPRIRSHTRDYWRHVVQSSSSSPELQRALTESPVGRPLVNPHYPLSSPLLIQHGYHVLRLLETTHLDLAALRLVVDFGGGYGGFCRLLRNIGYREDYLIWDLPVMCALQRFYLRNVFPTGPEGGVPSNIGWLTSGDPAALQIVIQKTAAHKPSLFVATWSLSETPLRVRGDITQTLGEFSYILLAYQRAFGGNDNVSWFRSLENRLSHFRWHHSECSVYRNNFYLIGSNTEKTEAS